MDLGVSQSRRLLSQGSLLIGGNTLELTLVVKMERSGSGAGKVFLAGGMVCRMS